MSVKHRNSEKTSVTDSSPGAPHSIPRRRFLKAAGLAGVAAAVGAPVFAPRAFGATKTTKTLSILQWSHFVPAYDTWFDAFAKSWGDANGVRVSVDHISIGDLITTTASEMSAGSGHDVIELLFGTAQFAPNVIDLSDVNQQATKQFGKPLGLAPLVSYNPTIKSWYAFCHAITPDPGNYRRSLWEKGGLGSGPENYKQLLDVGTKIFKGQRVPVGLGLSQCLDSNMSCRAILWSFGATVQDAHDNVVLGDSTNRKRLLEAFKYMADLYRHAMTPAVLAWNDASNNQALVASRASYIMNTVSAYRSAQEQVPDVAKDVYLAIPPAGPTGDRMSPVNLEFDYIVPKFAKAHEDVAKQFMLHLVANGDQAFYKSKLYDWPVYLGVPVPSGNRGYPAVAGAKTLAELQDAWFTHDPYKLAGEADGKLLPLKTASKWMKNAGYPGYSNPAVGEVFNTFVIPNMFAKAASGSLTPENAVDQATKRCEEIYARWRTRGLIGGTKS